MKVNNLSFTTIAALLVFCTMSVCTAYVNIDTLDANGGRNLNISDRSETPAPERPDKPSLDKYIETGISSPRHGFISSQQADSWEKALISGNGKMGVLVMGHPKNETIIVNHAGLFMPLNEPLLPVNQASHLAEIRGLIAEGQYQRAADLVVELSQKEGYGEKRWTDPFVPAFDILVSMTNVGNIRDYVRGVDFQTGLTAVRWIDEQGIFVRKIFVSRADNVIVLSISSPNGAKISCSVSLAQHPGAWGIKSVYTAADNNWLTYRMNFKNSWKGSLQGCEGVARVVVNNGEYHTNGDSIIVRDADSVIVITRAALTKNFAQSGINSIKRSLARINPDFGTLLDKHVKVHSKIFNRVQIDLGGGDEHLLTSEELLAKSKVGNLSKALLEKEFDAGRYAILSSSGDMPPNLQGIWTGTWTPAWSGDYTQNGNVQSAIASMLCTNMSECMLGYFNYLEQQMPEYRINAKRLFGCRGIHVPSRTSSHGLNNHFDRTWPMTFWTAGAGWAAHFFYDYYLYTGDKKFLIEHALPFMKEAAAFYEDFLFLGSDGKYVFNPSYSPENNPGNSPSQACVNATMDIAVAKELLTNLVTVCEEMGIEKEKTLTWKQMLARMPNYEINSDGAIKEWTTSKLEDNYAHRHCSHLYALFDGLPEEIAKSAELRMAFQKAAELRMDFRRKENGGEMAFGLVQIGLSAASLRDAKLAYESIDWLANNYWFSNMVTTHNPGEIFNVDLCGGFPAIITKMLVQSEPGKIDLLPALPKEWESGHISGLLCRGQITVIDMKWTFGNISAVFKSPKRQKVTIWTPYKIKSVEALRNGKAVSVLKQSDNCFEIELLSGKETLINITSAH